MSQPNTTSEVSAEAAFAFMESLPADHPDKSHIFLCISEVDLANLDIDRAKVALELAKMQRMMAERRLAGLVLIASSKLSKIQP